MKRVTALAIVDEKRPVTRGDCVRGPRPCAWISCRYNLHTAEILYGGRLGLAGHALDDDATESEIDEAVDSLVELLRRGPSCALDMIDKHSNMTLEQIGEVFDLTRERIRQLETRGLRKLPRGVRALGVRRSDVHEPRLTPYTRDR